MTKDAVDHAWAALEAELDFWNVARRPATFWWRDDDAIAWTPALQHLLEVAEDTPVGLAVIPDDAQDKLAQSLAPLGTVTVLQHGWRHINHSSLGQQESELSGSRSLQQRLDELMMGRDRLETLFGSRALKVLVPPWNHIGGDLIPLLPSIGFQGLSMGAIAPLGRRATLPIIGNLWRSLERLRAEAQAQPVPGLQLVNVHVDLNYWRGGQGFVGETEALTLILRHLRDRRLHRGCMAEPIGILTHHGIQGGATGSFLRRLLATLHRHPAARFVAIPELFPGAGDRTPH